jgi:hypothetical protein
MAPSCTDKRYISLIGALLLFFPAAQMLKPKWVAYMPETALLPYLSKSFKRSPVKVGGHLPKFKIILQLTSCVFLGREIAQIYIHIPWTKKNIVGRRGDAQR